MVKVKVCGITQVETAKALNEALPDYAGFILTKGFRRTVDVAEAARIRRALDGRIQTVGVFVNSPILDIVRCIDDGIIDLVQLHGDEDGEYISSLKALRNVPVIKAIAVRGEQLPPCPQGADYMLLDAYVAGKRGGTGQCVEWKRYNSEVPVILAGGITPHNVKQAIAAVSPYAVDCSGGVETDGKKDFYKILEYVKNVREI